MQAEIAIPSWARHIVSDYTDMDRSPHPVDADKVSSFRIELPDDVYFEYAFLDEDGQMRADPRNDLPADNPWYPSASAIKGPDYRASEYARLDEELQSGTLDRHRVEGAPDGRARRLSVYTPEGYDGQELPLLLAFDGTAFLRLAGLPRVVEALLSEGRLRPARLAFLEPVERQDEYGFNEAFRNFVRDQAIQFLDERYPGTGERILMGASLGGLMSATLALHHPGEFGSLVTFSGAFLGSPDERDFYRSEESWVLQRLRSQPRLPLRWYAEVGTIEWLTDINREVRQVLAEKEYDFAFRERNAGHNWVNWRNGLADALAFVLPGE